MLLTLEGLSDFALLHAYMGIEISLQVTWLLETVLNLNPTDRPTARERLEEVRTRMLSMSDYDLGRIIEIERESYDDLFADLRSKIENERRGDHGS